MYCKKSTFRHSTTYISYLIANGCTSVKALNFYIIVTLLKSKSGLNVKHDITSEGVIDVGYTGSIVVKLYNHGIKPYSVKRGDKITQLVIMPIICPSIEIVEDLQETERGNGGFGSTGR